MRPQLKSNHVLFFILGAVFSLVGGSCELVGVGMMALPSKPGDESAGAFFAIFALAVLLVPASVLLLFGFKGKKRVERFSKLAGLAAASVRLPLTMVASDLGLSATEVRAFVLEALANGTLRGRLDVEHGAFVSATAESAIQQVHLQCRHCGATASVFVIPGQQPSCTHCRAPLV